MITIKHILSKEIKEVTELEYHMMMDSDAYTIVDVPVSDKDVDGDGKPDMNWTKSDIKKWLDAKGVEYGKSNNVTKSDLIALV